MLNPKLSDGPAMVATPLPSAAPRLVPRKSTVAPTVRPTTADVPSTSFSGWEAFGVKVMTLSPRPKAIVPVCSVVEAALLPVRFTFAPNRVKARPARRLFTLCAVLSKLSVVAGFMLTVPVPLKLPALVIPSVPCAMFSAPMPEPVAEPKLVIAEPVPVAGAEMRTCVSLMICVMVAPTGMFGPSTFSPLKRPVVLPKVTTSLPLVVVAEKFGVSAEAAVMFQVPLPILFNVAVSGELLMLAKGCAKVPTPVPVAERP